ncbi:uncharacterized protein LOC112177287 [Rosa chinensis]|uniref:uncharacterized protein LOC112177287 n=1 Tax=Rosa chinensis TaxID=74649 RepID=UPI001AD8C667|nr:uncharacterized protein LOC112177287 [Rosa chinensis]
MVTQKVTPGDPGSLSRCLQDSNPPSIASRPPSQSRPRPQSPIDHGLSPFSQIDHGLCLILSDRLTLTRPPSQSRPRPQSPIDHGLSPFSQIDHGLCLILSDRLTLTRPPSQSRPRPQSPIDHGLSLRSTTASVHSLSLDSLSHGLRLSLDHGLSLRPPRPQSSPSTLSQSRPSLFRLMSKSKQRISLGLRKIKTLFSEVLIEQDE